MIMVYHYTTLCKLLAQIGVTFHCSGPAAEHLGQQVMIEIADEQDSHQGVYLYFNIAEDGLESFVCQE